MMRTTTIWTAMAVLSLAVRVAWAQHPPLPHVPPPSSPHGVPNITPALPAIMPGGPGWPADQVTRHPGAISGVKSAPGVDETAATSRMPPLMPTYLVGPPPSYPPRDNAKPPAPDLKLIVADRIRLDDQAKEPSKLVGVQVELKEGGYLVTKKYEDYSSVLPDGRPRYLWEITYFVSESDIAVTTPDDAPSEPERPPSPFQAVDDKPPGKQEPTEIKVDTEDPFGLLDPELQRKREDKRWDEVINQQRIDEHIQQEVARQGSLLSEESMTEMEGIIAAAGLAGLKTALTAGTLVPVAGTVISGGTAFHDQYYKTRDTLINSGINPAEAHRQALLQALVVGGVAVGADLVTGSVLGKLKTVARFKAFDQNVGGFIEEAAKKGRIGGQNAGLAKQGVDAVGDAIGGAAIGTAGKVGVDTTTAIANSLTAGGSGGNRPAIAQRPISGGNTYGVHYRLP